MVANQPGALGFITIEAAFNVNVYIVHKGEVYVSGNFKHTPRMVDDGS
jgi:hypothetical protein